MSNTLTPTDPKHYMAQMLAAIGSITQQAIKSGDVKVTSEILPRLSDIESKLKALDNNNIAERLSVFDELLNSLDLNKNAAIVDDLLNILAIAKSAQEIADSSLDASANNATEITKLQSKLVQYEIDINDAIGSLSSKIDQIDNRIREISANLIHQNNILMVRGINLGVAAFAQALNVPFLGPAILFNPEKSENIDDTAEPLPNTSVDSML